MTASEFKASIVSELRAAISGARWTFALTAPDSVIGAVRKNIDADEIRTDRLESGDLQNIAVERWKGIAQTTLDDINAQMVILGGSTVSFSRVWSEIVIPTAEEVKQMAKNATPLLLVVAVILIALIVLKVS